MIPIAFVTDHIETLYELGVELVENLEGEGFTFENMKVMDGLNDHPDFIKALAEETVNCLKHEIKTDVFSDSKESQKVVNV